MTNGQEVPSHSLPWPVRGSAGRGVARSRPRSRPGSAQGRTRRRVGPSRSASGTRASQREQFREKPGGKDVLSFNQADNPGVGCLRLCEGVARSEPRASGMRTSPRLRPRFIHADGLRMRHLEAGP